MSQIVEQFRTEVQRAKPEIIERLRTLVALETPTSDREASTTIAEEARTIPIRVKSWGFGMQQVSSLEGQSGDSGQ